jgi:hypothetical protein
MSMVTCLFILSAPYLIHIYIQLNLFFCRWVIDPPLEVVIPAKRTAWPETTTDLPSELDAKQDQEDRRLSRTNKSSRSGSTTKWKGEEQGN